MHLFKTFFKLLWSYKATVLIYLVIFGFMMTMVGVLSSDTTSGQFEEANFTICYKDEDESELSRGIIDYLSVANEVTDVKDLSDTKVEDRMFFRVHMHEFKFSKGFEQTVLDGGTEGIEYISVLPSGAQSYVLQNQINKYLNTFKTYSKMGYTPAEACAKTKDVLTAHTDITIDIEESEKGDSESSFMYYTNLNVWYAAFTVMAMSAGVIILNSASENLSNRIEASSVSRRKRTFINLAGMVVFGLVIYVIFMIANVIGGYGSSTLKEYLPIIMVNNLLAVLSACSLVAFITSFKLTNKVMNWIAILVGLSASFLGGAFVPQFLLGESLLRFSKFLPTYWFVVVNNMTHSNGYGQYDTSLILQSFGIQALFILVFCAGTAVVSKIRTESRV